MLQALAMKVSLKNTLNAITLSFHKIMPQRNLKGRIWSVGTRIALGTHLPFSWFKQLRRADSTFLAASSWRSGGKVYTAWNRSVIWNRRKWKLASPSDFIEGSSQLQMLLERDLVALRPWSDFLANYLDLVGYPCEALCFMKEMKIKERLLWGTPWETPWGTLGHLGTQFPSYTI